MPPEFALKEVREFLNKHKEWAEVAFPKSLLHAQTKQADSTNLEFPMANAFNDHE